MAVRSCDLFTDGDRQSLKQTLSLQEYSEGSDKVWDTLQLSRVNGSHAVVVLKCRRLTGGEISKHSFGRSEAAASVSTLTETQRAFACGWVEPLSLVTRDLLRCLVVCEGGLSIAEKVKKVI